MSLAASAREALFNLTCPDREVDDEENSGTSKILLSANSPSVSSDVVGYGIILTGLGTPSSKFCLSSSSPSSASYCVAD